MKAGPKIERGKTRLRQITRVLLKFLSSGMILIYGSMPLLAAHAEEGTKFMGFN